MFIKPDHLGTRTPDCWRHWDIDEGFIPAFSRWKDPSELPAAGRLNSLQHGCSIRLHPSLPSSWLRPSSVCSQKHLRWSNVTSIVFRLQYFNHMSLVKGRYNRPFLIHSAVNFQLTSTVKTRSMRKRRNSNMAAASSTQATLAYTWLKPQKWWTITGEWCPIVFCWALF